MRDEHEPQWSYARQREVCRCGGELPCPIKRVAAELKDALASLCTEMPKPVRSLGRVATTA